MNKTKIFIASALTAMAAACSSPEKNELNLIPYPLEVEQGNGSFNAAGTSVTCCGIEDPVIISSIKDFAGRLSAVSGKEAAIKVEDEVLSGNAGGFCFILDSSLGNEEYTLDIDKKGVVAKASSLSGFLYAIQTLKQLLPVEIYGNTPAPEAEWSLPCLSIKDSPRFKYRGLHLDISRHFFDENEVRKIIDIMAVYKLNTLHWHLTDDQGWRVEIKKYPKLIEVGSVRKGTVIKKDWDSCDGIEHGGYYTQDQIREVVEYASKRGINIIPEIDLPGHMLAALAAYPQYGCTGGPYEVWGRWGIADDVLCAGNEKTMHFLEDILTEISDLFPYEYIHIGGDECPKVRWEKCPVCQAKIKELGLKDDENFNAEHYLQSYVMERMENFLATKGKKIIGWDEILEGKLGPNATIMSWRGSAGGIKASKMGHDVIMTPNSHFYFDYYQSKDIENEPFGIGGYVPVEKVYSYEPYTDDMDENARKHILGVQANVWTEYIASNEHLEYMILPRLAALSEVQWCSPENKNWDRFLESLSHEAAMYDIMGYNYAKNVFQIIGKATSNPEKRCVEVNLSTQGNAPIRYTLDGKTPDKTSTLYSGPVEIKKGCTLSAIVERDNMETRVFTLDFIDNKAMGTNVQLLTQPLEKYRYGAPGSLVDGIRGKGEYSSGEYCGWLGTPASFVIDMGGNETYSSITLGTLIDKANDIFPPVSITASISDNGKDFTEAGRMQIAGPGQKDKDGMEDYTLTFPETSARYIKVEAGILPLPAWHARHGNNSFIFLDEVVVK